MLTAFLRTAILIVITAAVVFLPVASVSAQKSSKSVSREGGTPRDFRSRNFLMHSDLPDADAKELLAKLEKMLALISKYWAAPNKKTIEIYVVDDLDNWPAGSLDPNGVNSLRGGGGITMSRVISRGTAFNAQAISFAGTERGCPLHEAVHAYCSQTFGTTGPVWYSEGMAEMGAYWDPKDFSVNCGEHIIRYIKRIEPKSLSDIVDRGETTGDSWQNYAWRWALCYLLTNNENYRDRFRPLGLAMLTKKRRASFKSVYGSMSKEINFEYRFFLKHIEIGFRADLCSWDWKTKYRVPKANGFVQSKISANRGWQPSRLRVEAGKEYQFAAAGTWKLSKSKDVQSLNANGDEEGNGKLVGILMDEYELNEPFEIGIYGTFTAPGSGNLLLRCNDRWNELADNTGQMTVRFKRGTATTPLPKPKELTEAE